MSKHFHCLRVAEVRRETPDCVSVQLDVPADLQQLFQYKAGQNLSIRKILNGEEVRRTYSLCSAPKDKEWRIAIKKVPGGAFSTYANEVLEAGEEWEVMPPSGSFTTLFDAQQKKNYLAIAAGSGITPVLSLIKTILATEPQSSFTLVYGNRNRHSILFFETLEALKNKYMDRFNLIHLLSREATDTPLNNGRVTAEKLTELEKLIDYTSVDECFLCGPEAMTLTARDFLEAKGLPRKKIHAELFNSGGKSQAAPVQQAAVSGKQTSLKLTLDGRTLELSIPQDGQTSILDAASAQGADLPYACKGGMCCTCKAKLLEGQVKMDIHWGLEDEQVANGYILTCQSIPMTERVRVDFDA